MYYLTTYDYLAQLRHKIKLGFKLNDFEGMIFIFYCVGLSFNLINYFNSNEFIEDVKKYNKR